MTPKPADLVLGESLEIKGVRVRVTRLDPDDDAPDGAHAENRTVPEAAALPRVADHVLPTTLGREARRRTPSRSNPSVTSCAPSPPRGPSVPAASAPPTIASAGERCCGLDLAWSARNASGIAVVDAAGRLLDSATVVSDDAIADWLAPHLGALAVVAVDAPLVVRNATGSRPVERELTRAFRSVDAGTYPSNRANPLFDPPRAETLAARFGWRVTSERPDPARAAPSAVAVETYPHPAMVALFGLDRVIPYKPRPTRSLDDRRRALGTLMTHLEAIPSLALATSNRWGHLRAVHAGAVRAVDLKRLEDELDGIFCAHLAWLWRTGSTALIAWGDDVDGFIVAPPPLTPPPT